MEYPLSWSTQPRRKQPTLYDEYLSSERSNAPSSPRSEQAISSASPGITSAPFGRGPGPSAKSEDDRQSPIAGFTTASSTPTIASSASRPNIVTKTTSSADSPTLPSPASASLRRKAPPPIATGLATPSHHVTPWDDPTVTIPGFENPPRSKESVPSKRLDRNSPTIFTTTISATTSPTSSTFSGSFAEKYQQARRRFGSVSSADLAASHTAAGSARASLSMPHPVSPALTKPPTLALPPLPPSASQPAFKRFSESGMKRPNLVPSISQPAFAVLSPKLATPGFIRPQSSRSDVTSISDPLPTANTRRVLHLMKTLCGRMSGGLVFRRSTSHAWISAYCFIEELEGSLMSEVESDSSMTTKQLIADLRGSQVTCHLDIGTEAPYVQVYVPTTLEQIHLKMPSQADLESWYAALLCWQPIARRGLHHRLPKVQRPVLAPRHSERPRQGSETVKEAPIVRIGHMVYWDDHVSFGNILPMSESINATSKRPLHQVAKSHGARRWRRVSCTLREDGELKFFTEADNQVVSVVQLSQLSRDAIARIDASVMDSSHCIAIFPHYTITRTAQSVTPQSIYLTTDSRITWEVWFVLLSAFTAPMTYGPSDAQIAKHEALPTSPGSQKPHMFRMLQTLVVKINDVRVQKDVMQDSPASMGAERSKSPLLAPGPDRPHGYYAEITVDGQLRARTPIKEESSLSWRQEYEFTEIPTDLSCACITLKYRPFDSYASPGRQGMPYYHDAYGQLIHPSATNADTGFVGVFRDQIIGRVDLGYVDLEARQDSEHWWPVLNDANTKVAEISLLLRGHDSTVLLREEYDVLSKMLHKFETGLTVQLSLLIPHELKRLSEVLVNIFQSTGTIVEWLMSLVEEEVDGVTKDSFLSKSRLIQEPRPKTGGGEHVQSREVAVRDMNKNATLEANLLFRGNTLLTKALDAHMRRIGRDYLFSAIGRVVEEINEAELDCEVDPNRVPNASDVQRNFTRLISTTEEVFAAIASSADSCPSELKMIFRHIRACAEDKYGDFLRTIKYSSVSGFLFLRLFCPAVLNPRLFGLLKVEPHPRSRRTFTLVAKSLQTLANMATFGSKEYWMEPMNAFLNSHRTAFKDFIDKVCFMAVEPTVFPEPQPAHSAPNAIRSRLPSHVADGLLSLPYLIDESKEYATLIDLWLVSISQRRKSSTMRVPDDDKVIQLMQATCKGLHQRAEECVFRAQKAARPGPELESQWEELVETLQASSTLHSEALPSDKSGETDEPLVEHTSTPPAQSLDAFRISGADYLSKSIDVIGATPPLQQLDWTTAPDGGAATAEAASLLANERSNRSAFILSSPGIPQDPISPALSNVTPASLAGSMPPSAPSSRPGSSLSMRASRMTRMRSNPNSDTEDGSNRDRKGSSRRDRAADERVTASARQESIPAAFKTSGLGSSGATSPSGQAQSKQRMPSREPRDRDAARESERQRIRDIVNGLTFGRRRAAAAAEKAAAARQSSPSSAKTDVTTAGGATVSMQALYDPGAMPPSGANPALSKQKDHGH